MRCLTCGLAQSAESRDQLRFAEPAGDASALQSPQKPAVDQLILWLLDEEAHLREIPFSEVIVGSTSKQ